MSAVTFRRAERKNVPLLIGLAGGTGSGKTMSAMRLAKGIAGGKPFAVIDTENGRAAHYADDFEFDHAALHAPFRPEAYAAAIEEAAKQGYGVIVVDSMSHEWDGDGGMLDYQEEEFTRLGGRDAVKMTSWIKPKGAHRKFVTRLLQVPAHVILCFRASEKVDMVRDDKGKMQVVPKRTLTGLDGWVPITEKNLPYELTLSCLLLASKPGVPQPIKLPDPLRPVVPLDRPLTAEVGAQIAAWAAGTATTAQSNGRSSSNGADKAPKLTTELLDLGGQLGIRQDVAARIAGNRADHATDPAAHVAWLRKQVTALKKGVAARAEKPDDDIPVPTGVGSET